MGAIFREVKVLDPWNYKPEFNDDGTEKHIAQDGARYHVISYHGSTKGSYIRCSNPNCEINREPKP